MMFDPLVDLVPVAPVTSSAILVVANAKVPASNLTELIALAKKEPGKLSYGSSGNGTAPHLAGEMFKAAAGVDVLHVPYRGAGPAVNDTVGGHVQLTFVGLGAVRSAVDAGMLKILAVAQSQRLKSAPQYPTSAEAGLPGYEFVTWFGVVAPKGTPAPVIATLVKHIHAMQDDPAVQQRLAAGGLEALKETPEQFGARMRPRSRSLRRHRRQSRQAETRVAAASVACVGKVLIVGGGIAGLTLAVALRRRGIGVDLVEIQPRWNVLGVGISLTGPTLRALKSIDLIDSCVAVSFGFDSIVFADAAGRQFGALSLPRLCGPDYPATVAIARSALHDVLIRAADHLGVAVRLGTTVSQISQTDDAAEVTFSDGRRDTYGAVIGCDGAHSTVRNLVFGKQNEQSFTGLAVWRATMPRHRDVDCMQMFYGPRTKAGVNPNSREEMFLFLVQPIQSGERLPPDRMHILLQEQLVDFSGPVLEHARAHITDPAKVDYRPMNAFLLQSPWHRGHVAVIGDAAHTTTPHLATGAGIAIEDAVVLAEMLAGDGAVPRILEDFVERRLARLPLGRGHGCSAWRDGKGQVDSDPVALRPDGSNVSQTCGADIEATFLSALKNAASR